MSSKRRTTEQLIEELRDFNHYESADRLAHLARLLGDRCDRCGRTDCDRSKDPVDKRAK